MHIPVSMQWTSLQIYIFFNGLADASWIVLNGGQFITGNIKLTALQALNGVVDIEEIVEVVDE